MWSKPDPNIADQVVASHYAPEWISLPKTGPEQVKHEIRHFRSVFPDLTYKIIELTAEVDKVWLRYRGQGTQEGTAWRFPASNKEVAFKGATTFYIEGNQIVNRWGAFSFYDILHDLGHVPLCGLYVRGWRSNSVEAVNANLFILETGRWFLRLRRRHRRLGLCGQVGCLGVLGREGSRRN